MSMRQSSIAVLSGSAAGPASASRPGLTAPPLVSCSVGACGLIQLHLARGKPHGLRAAQYTEQAHPAHELFMRRAVHESRGQKRAASLDGWVPRRFLVRLENGLRLRPGRSGRGQDEDGKYLTIRHDTPTYKIVEGPWIGTPIPDTASHSNPCLPWGRTKGATYAPALKGSTEDYELGDFLGVVASAQNVSSSR